jgi:hypothetical protein
VPRIEHRLVAPEAAAVIADSPAILTQLDPIGRFPLVAPTARADTEYLFLSN